MIFGHSMAANSIVSFQIRLKFKRIQAFIHVLITCKLEEDQMKNENARLVYKIKDRFFRRPRADNSVVCGEIACPKYLQE